jgi:putative membrane protein
VGRYHNRNNDRMSAITVDAGRDRGFAIFTAVVSAAALGFLFWLLVIRSGEPGAGVDLRFLPAVNAGFNSLSAALLTAGFVFIKQGKPHLHKYAMVGAFAASALFLVSYVTYHYVHGDTKFIGEGVIRPVYFAILVSHILLSVVVVPGALFAFWFAGTKRFVQHKKVTRVLFPVWLYVSVTGVVIFFMLQAWGQPSA